MVDPADLKKFAFELVNFHMFDAERIAANFKTNIEHGLTMNLAKRRLAENGSNMVDPPKDYPLWMKFFFSFISGFAPLLWIATALVFISWEPFGTPPSNLYNLILAIVLIIVIVVSGVFTFVQVRFFLSIHTYSSITLTRVGSDSIENLGRVQESCSCYDYCSA